MMDECRVFQESVGGTCSRMDVTWREVMAAVTCEGPEGGSTWRGRGEDAAVPPTSTEGKITTVWEGTACG